MVTVAATPERHFVYLLPGTWTAIFLVIAAVASIPLHISLYLIFRLSAASDVVFGIDALLGGIAADCILRMAWKRKLVFMKDLKIPVLWIWIPLCMYVMIAQPFSGSVSQP
jgi:hypothetical protein